MSGRRAATSGAASIRVALAATRRRGRRLPASSPRSSSIVTNNLTAQIDDRLSRSGAGSRRRRGAAAGRPAVRRPARRPAVRAPVLVWTISPDGTVVTDTTGPDAARSDARRSSRARRPSRSTARDVRRGRGHRRATTHVVVGQTLGQRLATAQSTIILAELVIAPILLAVVFLGAVAIGRRVAAPIERARRRQLEFTADASHELRTPLSVIEAQTSLALAQDREPSLVPARVRARRPREPADAPARSRTCCGSPGSTPRRRAGRGAGGPRRPGSRRPPTGSRSSPRRAGWRLDRGTAPGTDRRHRARRWLDRLLGVLVDNACKYAPEGGTVADRRGRRRAAA